MSNDALNEFEAPSVAPMSGNAYVNHLSHLEDLMFQHGRPGLYEAIHYLKNLGLMLTNKSHELNVSVKWDGSPALVCGINPNNGRFFVATKSAFNQTPKLNYTDQDIQKNHGNGTLSYVLQQALKYLPELGIKTVLQGDLLFVQADLVDGIINGQQYVMFKPNTIIYAIPSDTVLASIISAAKIGIVFHTEYLDFPNQKVEWVDHGFLNHTPDVWYRDASFIDNGYDAFTHDELNLFDMLVSHIEIAAKYIVPNVLNKFVTLDTLKVLTLKFINDMIRLKKTTKLSVGDFYAYIERKANDHILAGKTVATKVKRTKDKEELLNFISLNTNQMNMILGTWNLIVDAKHLVLSKFETRQSHDNNIKTFVQDGDNFTVTNPEGFVVATKTGNTIKLVNRFEFAYHNFNNGKYS